MSFFIDIGIIMTIILSTLLGYKKGLIGVAFKIISFLLSIVLAFVLCKPVSNYIINNTSIDNSIQKPIENTLMSNEIEEESIEEQTMPEVITEYIQEEMIKATENAKNQIATVVAQNVTFAIINAISFIIIFITSKIILLVLKLFSEQLTNMPIIKQFNKLGGTIYGVIRGFFILYLLFGVVSLILPIFNNIPLNAITNSYLGNIFYNNNLLLKILF